MGQNEMSLGWETRIEHPGISLIGKCTFLGLKPVSLGMPVGVPRSVSAASEGLRRIPFKIQGLNHTS